MQTKSIAKNAILRQFISMADGQNLQEEIRLIHERNRRVEADKAWETSWFRVLTITCIIYIIAAIFMILIRIENPWLNAFVPAGGYFLSEQSLPFIKKLWLKHMHKNDL